MKINAKEFRKVCRLLKSSCCNLSDGNCLLLDDGETHTCVQLISKFHIFCNYFNRCVLPLDKELYSKLMERTDYKICACCSSKFYSSANGDGEISVEDVTQIQLYLAKLIEFDDRQWKSADTDKNGLISVEDVTQLQLFIAKLIPEL